MIDLKSLYENIVELQKRLEQATIDRAVLEEQVSAQTQTNKNRISELNSRKNKLNTQLKTLQRQRNSSENIITIDKLNVQITTLEKQMRGLSYALRDVEEKLQRIKNNIKDYKPLDLVREVELYNEEKMKNNNKTLTLKNSEIKN